MNNEIKTRFSVREIAQQVSGKVIGKADVLISGLEQIEQAQAGHLTLQDHSTTMGSHQKTSRDREKTERVEEIGIVRSSPALT